LFRLPDYLLNALKSSCFVNLCTPRAPEFSKGLIEVQELVDLGYLATRSVEPEGVWRCWLTRVDGVWKQGIKVYETSISPKGKEALLANLHLSELVTLIQDGVAVESYKSAVEFVIGVPKKFLPELLSSSAIDVREAARERLDKLNGLERRTNWLAC